MNFKSPFFGFNNSSESFSSRKSSQHLVCCPPQSTFLFLQFKPVTDRTVHPFSIRIFTLRIPRMVTHHPQESHPPSKGMVTHHPQDDYPPTVKWELFPGRTHTIFSMLIYTWSLTLAQPSLLICLGAINQLRNPFLGPFRSPSPP